MTTNNFYIYSSCDFSTKTAAATRMFYYARSLADVNNAVYLVTCSLSSIDDSNFIEVEENIFVLDKIQLTRKFYPILSFLKKLYKFSAEKSGESTFILYPYPYFNLEFLSVLFLIFRKKARVFYELNEVKKYSSNFHEPLSLLRLKYSTRTIYHKCRYIFMDNLMPFFTGLICISTNIEKYGKRFNKNTLRIPILTNPELKFEISTDAYTTEGYFNIGFSGSIVPSKENLFGFIDCIKKINASGYKIMFNLCGTVSPKNKKLLFEDGNDNDISYYGKLDENQLSNFLSQQNLLVVPRGYTLQNNYGFSTKLSDYLNHQKMVLVTDISDTTMYIKDGVNGFVVPPDDMKKIHEKLLYIIKNFNEVEQEILSNALTTSKNDFNYKNYSLKLRNFLISSTK